MSTVRSRIQKGRSFQKRVCELFMKTFDLDCEAIRTPVGAECGPDLVQTKRALAITGCSVEMKCVRSISVWSALEQCIKNTVEGTYPLLIFRRSVPGNKRNWACLPLEEYLKLRRENLELKGELPNE